jgi:hypothetical protein
MTEYVIIVQWDNKDEEHVLNYVQWTGNEKLILKLMKAIDDDPRDGEYGECYSYTYSHDKIPESAVNAHLNVSGQAFSFKKYSNADEKALRDFIAYVRYWVRSRDPNVIDDGKQCPWCGRWALKDEACNYIFGCGYDVSGTFRVGTGCGRPWCWQCGRKFCGVFVDPATGQLVPGARTTHDAECCRGEPGFSEVGFCEGGHNSHCGKRWEGISYEKN